MKTPSVVERNTLFASTIDNCTGIKMQLDFGDCNVINTSLCSVEHIYNVTGFLELILQPKNHSITRHLILVQDPVQGFQVIKMSKAIILGNELVIHWKLDFGTPVFITLDYGDNTTYNAAFSGVLETMQGNNSHIYKSTGIYSIKALARNELSNITVIESVSVEISVTVSCLLVQNLGPFVKIYQKDVLNITVQIVNGSNAEFLFVMGDGSTVTQSSTELLYQYDESGVRNITVVAYNNVSSVQIKRTINIHKINRIKNCTLHISPVNFFEMALMSLNVSEGFPYQCLWDFGDGRFNQTTSFDNTSSIYHLYEFVGVFNVVVNCSNNLGHAILTALVAVQEPIKNVSFTNDGPKPIDRSVTFNVFSENKGTNSCYILDLGDGTVLGYGHDHCSHETIPILFHHFDEKVFPFRYNYSSLGRYNVRLKAWNLVSAYDIHDIAIVVKIPCNLPTIKVPEFDKDNFRPVFTPSQTLRFTVFIKIDCRATDERDIKWTASLFSPASKDKLGYDIDLNSDNRKLEELTIKERTLTYGVYLISCNVSMVGQMGVYSVQEGFVEVVGNPLIPLIDGGSLIVRGFDKPCTFDGSGSHDPDEFQSGFSYFWLCQNASLEIPTEIASFSSEPSFSSVPVFNEKLFCSGSGRGILMKGGSSIGINTGNLQPYSSYAVTLFVAKTVNRHFRVASVTQVVNIVDGDPPDIKIR